MTGHPFRGQVSLEVAETESHGTAPKACLVALWLVAGDMVAHVSDAACGPVDAVVVEATVPQDLPASPCGPRCVLPGPGPAGARCCAVPCSRAVGPVRPDGGGMRIPVPW